MITRDLLSHKYLLNSVTVTWQIATLNYRSQCPKESEKLRRGEASTARLPYGQPFKIKNVLSTTTFCVLVTR